MAFWLVKRLSLFCKVKWCRSENGGLADGVFRSLLTPAGDVGRVAGGRMGLHSPVVASGLIFSMILSPIPFTLVRSSTVAKLPLVVR